MNTELFNQANLEKIRTQLLKRKETIATAESVTTGLLQAAIAQAECAAEFFQGGITTYNLGQKYRHLRVEPIHAQATNCVSEKVSMQMALQVNELFNSDWGIASTGYATPVPESGQKVFAFYAIAYRDKIVKKGKITAKKEEPFLLQLNYVNTILRFLAAQLRQ